MQDFKRFLKVVFKNPSFSQPLISPKVLWLIAMVLFLGIPQISFADDSIDTGWVRRIVVFPMVAPQAFSTQGDATWWRVREVLTEKRRFMIASKKFLQQKDVFQPREKLTAADSVLLGKLLEADAIILMTLKERNFEMTAYSASDGLVIWREEAHLHPSLPIADQMESTGEKLIRSFIAHVPFQGIQVVDPLIGTAVYEEGDSVLAKVDVGTQTGIEKNDPVQWIKVERTNTKALFQDASKVTVIAEGEVIAREREIAIVEIKRTKDRSLLKERSLVRFPEEAQRLKDKDLLARGTRVVVGPELLTPPLTPTVSQQGEARPLVTAIASLANLIAFLLIAL